LAFFSLYISTAQAQLFPIDSVSQKITYTDIVVLDSSFTASILYKNAEIFFQENFPKSANYNTQFDLKEGFISCQNAYLVYTKGGISKEIHGKITYDVKVEIKNNKYRYTFTNYIFEYYAINREFKYMPTGRLKPLETKKYHGWQPAWNKHKRMTHEKMITLIQKLKTQMSTLPASNITPTRTKKAEW
jgi:hypothetical protein